MLSLHCALVGHTASQGRRAATFPKLYPLELHVDAAAGGEWRIQAMHRELWRGIADVWIERCDLPWASRNQNALMMY